MPTARTMGFTPLGPALARSGQGRARLSAGASSRPRGSRSRHPVSQRPWSLLPSNIQLQSHGQRDWVTQGGFHGSLASWAPLHCQPSTLYFSKAVQKFSQLYPRALAAPPGQRSNVPIYFKHITAVVNAVPVSQAFPCLQPMY